MSINPNKILTLRTPSGISGDMFLAGLSRISQLDLQALHKLIDDIGVPDLKKCLSIKQVSVKNISGWQAIITLPDQVKHRTYLDIKDIITTSQMTSAAKVYAESAFSLLAEAESLVHDIPLQKVTFHEIGALDSILDICLSCALFDKIAPDLFVCSPLPVCDGTVVCAHGLLSTPTPAVLQLLEKVPVYGVDSWGETITPSAIALLKAFGAKFGPWPKMLVNKVARVYGTKIVPNLPNGAIFVVGCAEKKGDLH